VCRKAGLLIGWQDGSKRALVAWANCDSWSCTDCAKRMVEYWSLRAGIGVHQILRRGEPLDFVTLTSHEVLKNFAQTENVWRKAWSPLYNAIKRKNIALEYMIIPEKHKDGRMHVHALWNAGVSKKWLKDNARARGFGYQAKRKPVVDATSAVRYVGKYVGKSLGEQVPKKFRRVRVSQGWPEIPMPVTPLVGLRWEYISGNGTLAVVMAECQAKHIDLIDLRTGEMYDAEDLGTIADEAYT